MPRPRNRPASPKNRGGSRRATRYRVWIARYQHKAPASYTQVPADAIACEPAEAETMSARQAVRYVEAFNRAALARRCRLWAVALPVEIRFEGEPCPGETIGSRQ